MRLAKLEDKNKIMDLYNEAKEFMWSNGINQWTKDYPSLIDVKEDISTKELYVFGDPIYAVAFVSFKGEEDYKEIYEGFWDSNKNYAVIHRISVNKENRGEGSKQVMKEIKDFVLKNGFTEIRIDTHRDNIPMQKYLKKNGFIKKGIIYAKYGGERLGYLCNLEN